MVKGWVPLHAADKDRRAKAPVGRKRLPVGQIGRRRGRARGSLRRPGRQPGWQEFRFAGFQTDTQYGE